MAKRKRRGLLEHFDLDKAFRFVALSGGDIMMQLKTGDGFWMATRIKKRAAEAQLAKLERAVGRYRKAYETSLRKSKCESPAAQLRRRTHA